MHYSQPILGHPPPLRPDTPALPPRAAPLEEPGAAGKTDAEAPFASPAPRPASSCDTQLLLNSPSRRAEPVHHLPAKGSTRWHDIQAMFIDDPRASTELAASLVDASVEALVMSVKERQKSLLSAW